MKKQFLYTAELVCKSKVPVQANSEKEAYDILMKLLSDSDTNAVEIQSLIIEECDKK